MSDVYRERLARMAGGGGSGGGDSKASSSALRRSRPSRSETTASRVVATRGPSGPSAARSTSTSGSISSGGSSGRGYQSSSLPMEYKQMRNEMNSHSSGAVVSTRSDAAALQNDLAQRFNLSNAVRPSQKKKRSQVDGSRANEGRADSKATLHSRPPPPRQCDSCDAVNPYNTSVCETCGYFLSGAQQVPLTMAQSRGLVAIPTPAIEPLKDYEWDSIEKGVAGRQDAYCPICMEGFNRGFEVLLSCSHMYHRSCLQSFEKFMKTAERACPICRTSNYQKKITHAGTKAFELVCAITIQKNWRGYWCRNLYYEELKHFYKNGGGTSSFHKKKFYEKELSSHANRLAKEGDSMEHEVNSLFSSMDKVMQDNRDLDLAFELMMMERHNYGGVTEFNSTGIDHSAMGVRYGLDSDAQEKESGEVSRAQWNDILGQCLKRGNNVECAICMSDIEKNRNRRVVLLSCSHMFHQQCIMMLEDFVKNSEDCPLCPMCRCPFERKLLSRDCDAFDDAPKRLHR